jgi:hypothetical protein
MKKYITITLAVVAIWVFVFFAIGFFQSMAGSDPRWILATSKLNQVSNALESAGNCEEAAFATRSSTDDYNDFTDALFDLTPINNDLFDDLVEANRRFNEIMSDLESICPVESQPLARLRERHRASNDFIAETL